MTKTQTAEPLVASDVLERVLAKGRSTGAEFAEVYIEDKRSTSAGLDDGKVEQVTSGRDRGAGIRVVSGETTGLRTLLICQSEDCWPQPRPLRLPQNRAAAG